MQSDLEYLSPDGLLRFVVTSANGDVTLGFAGTPWHTHGEVLAAELQLPIDEAVRAFSDGILGSRTIIAVSTINGAVRDIWPTTDPVQDLRYREAGEDILFRFWDGRLIEHE